jgi:hypothetical protein
MAFDINFPYPGITPWSTLYAGLRDNFNYLYTTMSASTAWTAVASISGWTLNSTTGYMRDPFGFVRFRGHATAGGSPVTTLFTLNSGYRPIHARQFPAIENYVGSPLYMTTRKLITVNSNGTVVAAGPVSTDIAHFTIISFKAGA